MNTPVATNRSFSGEIGMETRSGVVGWDLVELLDIVVGILTVSAGV